MTADIMAKTDGTVWLCGNTTRFQLATTGGSSQANQINACVQRGAVDRRATYTQTLQTHAIAALAVVA